MALDLPIQVEREVDGRWIAEMPALPGVIVYGATLGEVVRAVRQLGTSVVEDRRMHGEPVPMRLM